MFSISHAACLAMRMRNSDPWAMRLRFVMGLLPDTQNCGLRMRRECWERFSRHRGLAIPTCITDIPHDLTTVSELMTHILGKKNHIAFSRKCYNICNVFYKHTYLCNHYKLLEFDCRNTSFLEFN